MRNSKRFSDSGFRIYPAPITRESVKDGVGCSGALVKMPGFASGGNSTLVYFNCADCAVITEKAKDLIRYKNAQRLFKI